MRVLVLTDFLPNPANGGAALRTYGLVSHLAARHEVMIFAPRSLSSTEQEDAAVLEALGIRVECGAKPRVPLYRKAGVRVKALFSEIPSHWVISADPFIREGIGKSCAEFKPDVTIVEHLSMCRFIDALPIGTPIVLDNHNVESLLENRSAALAPWTPAGLLRRLECRKVSRYEARMMERVDLTIAVSDLDKPILQGISPSARVVTVENGIDPGDPSSDGPVGMTAVFTGMLGYLPNIEAARLIADEILPKVRKSIPEFRVKIVGRNPDPSVLRLSRPGLEIIPNVPDIRPFIEEAGVVIVPLKSGSGTRLKILEAMARSKCVISTSKGAEGLEVTDGVDILIRDEMKSFAIAIVHALRHPDEGRRIGENARATVLRSYTNERLSRKLEGYLMELTGAGELV